MDKQETGVASQDAASMAEFLGEPPPSFWRRHRKWLLAGVAVLVVVFLVFGRGGDDEAIRYATAKVTRGNLEVKISATGNLAPTNEVTVGSELSGLVDHVYVDVNDRVTRGQPIAQLDTSRLRDAIKRSQASLRQAEASVAQAQASEKLAIANLARLEEVLRLSGGKVPSAAELDGARAEKSRASANVLAAEAQVQSAKAQVSSDNTNLAKATIRSPANGVVLARQIEPGQTVAASFNTPTLFRIAEDLSSMELEVKVDEADVGEVKAGLPATFSVDAFPGRRFPASIKRVDVGANTSATGAGAAAGGSEVVAYTAVLVVENKDLVLRPGMTALAEIITSTERNQFLVPNAALRYKPADAGRKRSVMMGPMPMMRQQTKSRKLGRGSRQTLQLLGADGKLAPLEVVTGESDGSMTAVTGQGLREGLEVVTSELASPP
ncbi:MAG: efflux RND transporter periplasmic adaptor subunit [Gammaproteobacteria bacterium]